jgi:hypothetical protein
MEDDHMNQALAPYRRFLAALFGTVATVLVAATTDDVIGSEEVVLMAMSVAGLMSTYALPDTPMARFMKLGANAALNGLGLVAAWQASGQDITTSMQLQVVVAVLTGLGLIIVQNDPEPAVPPTAEVPARDT